MNHSNPDYIVLTPEQRFNYYKGLLETTCECCKDAREQLQREMREELQ